MFSTVTKYILDKVPVWILIPATIVYGPPTVAIVGLWYVVDQMNNKTQASMVKTAEIIELKYVSAIEKQNLINAQNNETLKRLDQHQTIIFEAYLNSQGGKHARK